MKIFTDEFLEEIGFKRTYKEGSYGKAIKGHTEISWNEEGHFCTYLGEELPENTSVGIKKDGGTRYVFNGYVFSQDDVKRILKLTW